MTKTTTDDYSDHLRVCQRDARRGRIIGDLLGRCLNARTALSKGDLAAVDSELAAAEKAYDAYRVDLSELRRPDAIDLAPRVD